jgi:tetratricopeptide (TPR) repeat protein
MWRLEGTPDRRLLVAAGGCAAVAAALHFTALHGGFVYDDFPAVVDNPTLRPPLRLLPVLLFTRFRPLVNLSYAADAALFGLAPLGFHLDNLLLHCANTALAVLLVDAAYRCAGVKAGLWWRLAPALAFAVHPMLTQPVSYVAARGELLSTFFAFLALLVFQSRRPWTGALAFACALAAKESAAAVPAVALCWTALLEPAARTRMLWALLALVAVAAGVRVEELWRLEVTPPRPLLANLALEAVVFWQYLALFLVPARQTLLHAVRELSSLAEPRVLLSVVGLVLAGAAALRFRRQQPLLALGAAWFALFLLPSSVIALREPMAEQRVYAASLGLFLLLGEGLRQLAGQRAGIALSAASLAICVPLTLQRNFLWSDPLRLWSEAADRAPDLWAAQYALGKLLAGRGDCSAAEGPLRKAVALSTGDVRAHNELARCLSSAGRNAEAFELLHDAVRLAPQAALTWANLAALALAARRPDKAREFLARALTLEPDNQPRRERLQALADQPPAEGAPWPPTR